MTKDKVGLSFFDFNLLNGGLSIVQVVMHLTFKCVVLEDDAWIS